MTTKLAARDIAELDPYKFMTTVGKRVIHLYGRRSTDALDGCAPILVACTKPG